MEFARPLERGIILKRYKRFLADVRLEGGEEVVAHVPNTGSMAGCWEPGWTVLCSRSSNPKRKLGHTLEMTHNGRVWIMVNTSRTNAQVSEGIREGRVPELAGFSELRPEVKVENGRIDLLLRYPSAPDCYAEVKNVTLVRDGLALFPDAVTTRGQKHLRELIRLKERGLDACMVFAVNREDADGFAPADDIDPDYGILLREAAAAGVQILPYRGVLGPGGISLGERLPLIW